MFYINRFYTTDNRIFSSVSLVEDEHTAYMMAVHYMPYITDLCKYNDELPNGAVDHLEKFDNIWNIKHVNTELMKISVILLKDFINELQKLFTSQQLGVVISEVKQDKIDDILKMTSGWLEDFSTEIKSDLPIYVSVTFERK